MSEQQRQVEEPLEQGPVEDAGPSSEGDEEAVVVDATVVEEDSQGNAVPAEESVPTADDDPEGQAATGGASGPEADADAQAEDGGGPGGATEDDSGDSDEAEPPETPLERAERERSEYLELAQRSRAEFENFRKRAAAQAAVAEVRGKAELARRMVPALDNLERALLAAGIDPDGEPGDGDDAVDALAGGVNLVLRDLREGLRVAGVESFNPIGERFDPNLHEALATGEAEGAESGSVIETMEKGYRIGDQVLRPARVVVAG